MDGAREQVRVRSLARFTGANYDKGRPVAVQAAWFAVMNLVFTQWWCPSAWRPRILRAFGATIGERVFIRHRVRVLWPWKLTIGDDSWIGEDVWLLNLEPIRIGHDVCLSQGAQLITGSHDRRSATFEFDNGSIFVDDGAWVAVRATVLRGVTIGRGATVGATALAHRDVPPGEVLTANGRTGR